MIIFGFLAGMPSAKIKFNFIMISNILIELEKFEASATPVQCYYSLILVAANVVLGRLFLTLWFTS